MQCWRAQVGLGGQTSALGLSLPAHLSFVCPSPLLCLLHMCPPWAPHHWLSQLNSHFSPLQIHVFMSGTIGITMPDGSFLFGGLEACRFWKAAGHGFPISSGCSSGRDEGLGLGWEAGSGWGTHTGLPQMCWRQAGVDLLPKWVQISKNHLAELLLWGCWDPPAWQHH